jgi:hypothetical protein
VARRLSHQSKTPSYIRREGGRATWEINREERGRVCRDQVARPGEQVADSGPEQAEEAVGGEEKARATKQALTQ